MTTVIHCRQHHLASKQALASQAARAGSVDDVSVAETKDSVSIICMSGSDVFVYKAAKYSLFQLFLHDICGKGNSRGLLLVRGY